MKSYIYIGLLIASFFILSCNVNELEPFDAISEELAFTTPEKIELAMAGVYDAAQSGFYDDASNIEGNNRGYIFGAAHVEQGDMRGEDMLLINTFYGITYQSTIDPTTPNNSYYWHNGFRVVNLANLFIEGINDALEAGIIDEPTKLAYEGEARLLRAITYHELVVHFARPYRDNNGSNLGLPIRTVGINSDQIVEEELAVGRSSVKEVYDFIIDDLDFAEDNLPANRSIYQVTRATSGAAIALKTRVYLHKGEWGSVITEGNKLVPQSGEFKSAIGGYKLTETVDGPWKDNQSSESIFSMEMSANDNLNVNAALANMYGTSSEGARGEVAISPIIWNETFWHEDDLRRTLLVASGASDRLFTTKYRDYSTNTDYSPIIRYAEVVLNVAEAEARAGDEDRALKLINAVRDRAIDGAMSSYTAASFSTDNDLIQAILNERRIEFLAEGIRWKDIHRNAVDPLFGPNGIPAKMLSSDVDGSTYDIGDTDLIKAVPYIEYADFRFIWPIPASEISSNPTLAEQPNPGY